jgi:hypothetical protein
MEPRLDIFHNNQRIILLGKVGFMDDFAQIYQCFVADLV